MAPTRSDCQRKVSAGGRALSGNDFPSRAHPPAWASPTHNNAQYSTDPVIAPIPMKRADNPPIDVDHDWPPFILSLNRIIPRRAAGHQEGGLKNPM